MTFQTLKKKGQNVERGERKEKQKKERKEEEKKERKEEEKKERKEEEWTRGCIITYWWIFSRQFLEEDDPWLDS